MAEGLHITHWTSEDLARQAVADGIVPAISARTIRQILHDVDLQPHRTRYRRTARLDDQFKQRAEWERQPFLGWGRAYVWPSTPRPD